jgi:hypothetical protein
MFRRFQPVTEAPELEHLGSTVPAVPSRACCCPAGPVVKVIMPPTADRRHSVDLWLCGHHYHASAVALLAAGAYVEDLTVPAACPAPAAPLPRHSPDRKAA